MKEEVAKMIEKGFLIILSVSTFCIAAIISAVSYSLVRNKVLLFAITHKWLFRYIVLIAIYVSIYGIYIGIKYIRACLDR